MPVRDFDQFSVKVGTAAEAVMNEADAMIESIVFLISVIINKMCKCTNLFIKDDLNLPQNDVMRQI